MSASIIALVSAALETLKVALPMLPNHTQKVEEEYAELLLEFTKQLTTETPDLRVLGDTIDKLMCHVQNIRSQVRPK